MASQTSSVLQEMTRNLVFEAVRTGKASVRGREQGKGGGFKEWEHSLAGGREWRLYEPYDMWRRGDVWDVWQLQ